MRPELEVIENDKVYRYGDLIGKIHYDPDLESPRDWQDNLCKMFCFHKKYRLGDQHDLISTDFSNWGDMERSLKEEYLLLPMYMYDHSGLTVSTTKFSCHWDSGQIGFIGFLKSFLEKERMSDEEAERIMLSEVEVYDLYLRGERYGYEILKEDDVIDSCWGYYGLKSVQEALFDEIQSKSDV